MAPEYAPQPSQETDSLVKRLAGPSTTKAGLAKDQTEINRIIADASKGSQFYENEKRKDKDLTERITRILKERDDAVKGVDIQKVEEKADHLLAKLEAERDLSQYIVHVDMDAFYANVELLHNPSLAGKPFGVGHGVLTTASYEARRYGVRSGMPGFIAKKLCPELIIVPINFSRYGEMSKKVMNIFRRYDPNMLAASVDEGYLNITPYCKDHGLDPDECVQQMRKCVVDETDLTVSAGIAANKMLAKICSDKNKPNGQFHLSHDSKAIKDFMHDLSIRKIPGVGRVNERLLESIGIQTCGDIYTHRGVLSLMDKQFGLKFMLRTHLGIASNVVQPWVREERKSIGAERTFNPIGDTKKIFEKLEEVAEELENDMESGGWTGRTITLKYKLDTYQVFTRAKSLTRWVTKKEDIFAIGKELLLPELPLRIRLIGIRATKLKDLRKAAEPTGIKRFFESRGSPRKRQKKEHHPQNDDHEPTLPAHEHNDDDEEVMPGFHEHEQEHEVWDVDAEAFVDSEVHQDPEQAADPANPRPPVSAPAPVTSRNPEHTDTGKPRSLSSACMRPPALERHGQVNAAAGPSSRPKPPSTSNITNSATEPAQEPELACPICAQACADNDSLNTHVDWCLSREAIRSAAAEGDGGQASAGAKPQSKSSASARQEEAGKECSKEWWKVGPCERHLPESKKSKSTKGRRKR
ncbi:DNA/RNA polymerase [Dentipellis sp. KUC8613]|nr:DNA/RNA polymerase [Dentipellis sp. KUC8613]